MSSNLLKTQVVIDRNMHVEKGTKIYINFDEVKINENISGEGEIVINDNKEVDVIINKNNVNKIVSIKKNSNKEEILNEYILNQNSQEKYIVKLKPDNIDNLNTQNLTQENLVKNNLIIKNIDDFAYNNKIEIIKTKSKLKITYIKLIIKENKSSSKGFKDNYSFDFKYFNQNISHSLSSILAFDSLINKFFYYENLYFFQQKEKVYHPPIYI